MPVLPSVIRNQVERAPRFPKTLALRASTFGAKEPHDLMAINISYTGLLVGSLDVLPFQVKTLIELEIDLEKEGLAHNITCIAKIVRSVKGDSAGLSEYISFFDDVNSDFNSIFGIQIREMSDYHLRLWKEFIESLDKGTPQP